MLARLLACGATMYRYIRNLAFATAILTAPAMADEWPEALKTALTEPENDATYSYNLTTETSGEMLDVFFEAFIDPTRPPEERIEILFPPPGKETDDVAEFIQKLKDEPAGVGNIWCAGLAGTIPKDAVLVDETPDTLVYSFRPIADKDLPKDERKIYKKLEGQIVIDKNTMTVQSYRLKNHKHIRMMFVAKIRYYLQEIECELAPNGRSHMSKIQLTTEIGILGYKSIDTITMSFSNLTPVDSADTTSDRSF